jgi:hypothetical protein
VFIFRSSHQTQQLSGSSYSISVKQIALLLPLFTTFTFFLWMFLATESLEQMADAYRISGPQGADVRAIAYQFAAQWRHGMTGEWPLYMPGFFATAVATWFWINGRTLRRLISEAIGVLLLASLTAKVLAPAGALYVVDIFERQTGLKCEGAALESSISGASAGIYTLVTWVTFVMTSQRALAGRTYKPLWLPAMLCIGLAIFRPMTVDDFTAYWARQVIQGDGVAIFSLLLVPGVASVLTWRQLMTERKISSSDRVS